MYEIIFTFCGIIGIIIGIFTFLKYRRIATESETVSAVVTELRDQSESNVPLKAPADVFMPTGVGIVPIVMYEKDGKKLTAGHYRGMSTLEINYSIGDDVLVNIIPGLPRSFYFNDQEKLFTMRGLQFLIGGGISLAMGIILLIALK